MSGDQPLLEFTSHTSGRNAKVRVFPTHIEVDKPRSKSAGAAIATGGFSMLVPRKHDVETFPVKAISSVNTHGRFGNSILTITVAGNVMEAKVSSGEAERIKSTLLQLMNGGGVPVSAPTPAPAPVAAAPVPPPSMAGWRPDPTDSRFVTWHDGQRWHPETKRLP